MYSGSFLCEVAKIKQRTPLKKELCEIGEEAIWGSRFTSFFKIIIKLKLPMTFNKLNSDNLTIKL